MLNHLTRRKNAEGAIDYSFSVSLVHQDLGIDEAASENKPSPLWDSNPEEHKQSWRKYSAGTRIRGIPLLIERPLHVFVFVLETNLGGWKLCSI